MELFFFQNVNSVHNTCFVFAFFKLEDGGWIHFEFFRRIYNFHLCGQPLQQYLISDQGMSDILEKI